MTTSSTQSPLPIGTRLQGGAFTIGKPLGAGALGFTYKGGDLQLRRVVAVKEYFPAGSQRKGASVFPEQGDDADFQNGRQKFFDEARTLARFNHPGIVRIFNVFEENNTAYVVMEFLDGQSLQAAIERKTLSENAVVELAKKIGSALGKVHDAGLIHRDIRPANIFLTQNDRAILIGFGASRGLSTTATSRATAAVSPDYAPLELMGLRAEYSSGSDIFSLGATLYYAITGTKPTPAADRAAGSHLTSPHQLNPKISDSVSRALVWALELRAADRPQSVEQFLEALHETAQTQQSVPVARPSTLPTGSAWSTPSPASPRQLSIPAPSVGGALWMRPNGPGQFLTNADPQRAFGVLIMTVRALNASGISPDVGTLRVFATTGGVMGQWGQALLCQVLPGPHGNAIVVTPRLDVKGTSAEKSRPEIEVVLNAFAKRLQADKYAMLPLEKPAPIPTPGNSPPSPFPTGAANFPQRLVAQRGKGIMTMAVLGIVGCTICSPIAWFLAIKALKEYGDTDPGDRPLVIKARNLAIAGTALMLLGMVAGSFLLSAASSLIPK